MDKAQQNNLQRAFEEEVYLLGQPPLRHYLRFVEDFALDSSMDRASYVDEWRRANDYYRELEDREAGIADNVEVRDLDPGLVPLAEAVRLDARYRHTFSTLPTSFGVVELDRLVIFQPRVTQDFVNALKSELGSAPDRDTVFHFCLPLKPSAAPVSIQRVGSQRYVFRCESTDFHFQESVLLKPGQIQGHDNYGTIAGAVGLMVGFGSNWLNVIRDENRLLLHNGYHRAYALRELGITHAPCIIQTVTRRDELDVIAKREVAENPGYYFAARRPPLLKDFFDPNLRKVLRVRKLTKMVEINFEVKELTVPV